METTILKDASIITPAGIISGSLILEGGKIVKIVKGERSLSLSSAKIIECKNAYVAPAFIDLHIHGSGGYGTEDMSADALLHMSMILGLRGVGSFCPTLYPAKPEKMIENVLKLVPAFGREKGARFLGLHLEGPFISPEKPGVMKPKDITGMDIKFLKKLWEAGDGKIKIITFAPEEPGADELIKFANQHNILLQIGHTNATYDDMMKARAKGISHVTHLFNAMSPFNHREPGAAGAAMMEDFSFEIIADGRHVHPAVVSFLGRVKKPEQINLVTDALRPTSQKEGELLANHEHVVLKDGLFKRVEDDVIAGSALTMIDGVKNLVDFGFTLPHAIMAASTNPARILGLKDRGTIEEGLLADLVVFDKKFNIKHSLVGGKTIV
ncbi:N-acetylglucosamine-6-phosphate deacetylase [Elusimicrobium posterum]|uniref:N-acetylglucosamine-6-phosphate deacetylase n=1 Tax=Elusimicrobium posterum TaxID=3116653 RepID=UPI003C759B7A